jgi:hypothetical protein
MGLRNWESYREAPQGCRCHSRTEKWLAEWQHSTVPVLQRARGTLAVTPLRSVSDHIPVIS